MHKEINEVEFSGRTDGVSSTFLENDGQRTEKDKGINLVGGFRWAHGAAAEWAYRSGALPHASQRAEWVTRLPPVCNRPAAACSFSPAFYRISLVFTTLVGDLFRNLRPICGFGTPSTEHGLK